MTLIVENGDIVAGSESYESVSGADLYHSNRGNSAWAALTTQQKEIALRKATDYLTQNYRNKWEGFRVSPYQSLDWPRYYTTTNDTGGLSLIEPNVIPVEIRNACCELALRSVNEDLNPDIGRETISESIGSISVTYSQGSRQNKQFKSVEMMLMPFLKNGGSRVGIVRA